MPKRIRKHIFPITVGAAVIGMAAVAGPSMIQAGRSGDGSGQGQRIRLASLPRDQPAQGLIYKDLRPAGEGSVCAGAYALDELTCTHGPDPAPAGLAVRRGVAPVTAKAPEPVSPSREQSKTPQDAEIVRDLGGSLLAAGKPALLPDAAPGDADFVMGTHDVACAGDGRDGNRVQVVYVHALGTPSRYTDFVGSIRVWAAGVDAIYDSSAGETGGSRHIRYVTTPSCRVDVAEVQVPVHGLDTFPQTVQALKELGYNRTDRKYLLFADATRYCGISTFVADDRAGSGNRNNGGPSYARVDSGCWSTVAAAQQLTRAFGATLLNSPNSSGGGSCTDDFDLLCHADRSGTPLRQRCPRKNEIRLDCGHDDYFSTNPPRDSWLAKNWNVAQSEFLLRGDGGDDVPDAPGSVPGEPAAPEDDPTVRPSTPGGGDASDGGGDAVPPPSSGAAQNAPAKAVQAAAAPAQAFVEVRDATNNSVRLTWGAAAPDATYQVAVDGVTIATTKATRAGLIGLRPDTAYQVAISSTAQNYQAKASARTLPVARPTQNSWFVLENALTGGAADLYAARTANGTAITLSGSDGDAQQQWMLVPAGGNSFSLKSRATEKCAMPLGGNPVAGAPVVQSDCAGAATGLWTLRQSAYGFSLRSVSGDFVLGVGGQRFGAQRVLVLQNGNDSRHQSWAAVPG
ncbi:RICIN domain-containing protein [Actinoplanes sp. NPDC049265]|uniref:RICIN domain-containing protein n=1 Tax=Actinoplanes sp. NPDC049265 TaxID=3363902 RepID=UPI00371B7DB2